ncbi:MAG: hypothetical protein LBP59_04330 [Planctomycetaceae bacterium]|nr:hypothetical protein [Planctomycetaceae bacterium]
MRLFFSNILNPLLLKELRQFVRNRFIIVLINIYILAIVIACLSILTFTIDIDEINGGINLLFALTIIVYITSFIVIVIRTAWTTATDKINEDLMLYSTMKPSTIVFGKLLSGAIMTLILMSVTMPFITLAYTLRGIDMMTILLLIATVFLGIQLLNSFAILVAASNKIRFSMYLTVVIVSIAALPVIGGNISLFDIFLYHSTNFSLEVFIILFFCYGVFFTIFARGSIVMFSPPTSNRILPFRILLTLIFIISLLAACMGIFNEYSIEASLIGFKMVCMIVAPFLIIAITCERDQWSNRIRKNLPEPILHRIIIFPFYSGAACGIIWFFLFITAIFLIGAILIRNEPLESQFVFNNGVSQSFGYTIFSYNYCVTAMLIRSRYFKKFSTAYVLLIAFILLLTFTLGSFLLYLLFMVAVSANVNFPNLFDDYTTNILSILNPFCDHNFFHIHRVIGMTLWFILLIPFLIKWYEEQLKNFNPHVKETITYEEIRNAELGIQN